MRVSLVSTFLPLATFITVAYATLSTRFRPGLIALEAAKYAPVNFSGFSSFQQLIDHDDPDLGTFNQRYWFNFTYWGGPGYPVVLFTPGETAADKYGGYLTDAALPGLQAKKIQAAVVMVEHRYWGLSTPFKVQDTEALQYLTLRNSVLDFVRFARNVHLPFDDNSTSNAPNAPWIMTGGSYSGALAAWTEKLSPGTFWAYHASSAPVQAIHDYWQYFMPIQEGMPKNCSRDMAHIIEHVDDVLTGDDEDAAQKLKDSFGLGDLEHDDFAAALAFPVSDWQSIQFNSGYSDFFKMCDAIEEGRHCGNGSTALHHRAVAKARAKKLTARFAAWFKNKYLPGFCAEHYNYTDLSARNSSRCFDTHNLTSPMYTDRSADNLFYRPWVWMTCNEPFFYFQTGAPAGRPTIASRLITAEYFERQCGIFFPEEKGFTYGANRGKTAEMLNIETEGWHRTDTKRLVWVNGEYDPWRSASVSSKFRPGGPLESTSDAPVFMIKNASHCQDLRAYNRVNPGVREAQDGSIAKIAEWVDEFWAINVKPRQRRNIKTAKHWKS